MRVDLAGLLLRAAEQIERPEDDWRDFYAFSLKEAAGHINDVRGGKHTLAEFADAYCLTPKSPNPSPVSEKA